MSNPAATLQCPNCGGVFLTIQQNGGGMEICPHCAVAAPRGSYRRVEGSEAFPRARTALPGKRAVPQTSQAADPLLTTGAIPLPPATTVPAAPPTPYTPAPFFTPSPQMVATAPTPAWQPQAPPQPVMSPAPPPPAPVQAPPPSFYPAAPESPPPPPPQAFFAPAPGVAPAPVPSPFAPAAQPLAQEEMPAPAAPSLSPFLQAQAPVPTPGSLPPPRATTTVRVPILAPTPVTTDLPPPQIGFAPAPAPPAPAPSHFLAPEPPAAAPEPPQGQTHVPFSRGTRLPQLKVVPAPGSFGSVPASPVAKPAPPESPPADPPPPVWPGLGAEGAVPAVEATVISPRTTPLQTRRREQEIPAPGWLEAQQIPMPAGRPTYQREGGRLWPWLSVLVVGSMLCGLGLSMWKSSQALVYPAAQMEVANSKPAAPANPTPTAEPSPTVTSPTAPPPSVPPAPTEPAPPPATDSPSSSLLTSGEAAEKILRTQELFATLQTAPTLEEKLKWIENGEAHRDEVAKFLASHADGLRIKTMDPNVGLFQELPSGDEVKLLVATTNSCPNGAMVRLHSHEGRDLLDWPLFAQTHELDFEVFVTRGRAATPRWFTLLCARSRSSGLEGPAREGHLALRAQGALSAKGEALIHVQRDSEAGRLLESRMTWGRVYLIRVELERLEINGKPTLMVVDCEGTTTAKAFLPQK